jgi:hypothetical protein
MSFSISQNANPNYLAKIIVLGEPVKHPNADRLQGFIINSNRTYTDLSYNQGDICIYFEFGCQIDEKILYTLNLYEENIRNKNQNERGFFRKNGYVRKINLRGESTNGFLLKIDVFKKALIDILGLESINIDEKKLINCEFDSFNDYIFVKKYIPKKQTKENKIIDNNNKKTNIKRFNRIIDNQFRFHVNTLHINRNPIYISKGDLLSITYKIHGTSFIVSNVLVKDKMSFTKKLFKKLFKINIPESKYDVLYASRKVIKNNFENKAHQHYYGVDLYKFAKEKLEEYALKGYSIYGEMAGYNINGSFIQKNYDYGCVQPVDGSYIEGVHYKLFIYRITKTNIDGDVIEFTWGQIKDFCEKNNLRHVPELYYGIVDNFHDSITNLPHGQFQDTFISLLKEKYLEKKCFMCLNDVPTEGVVIRKDNLYNFLVYKYISDLYKDHENKLIESGEIDIETEQSNETN